MRKRIKKIKFSRSASQRKALLVSLATDLFLRERIKTTETKAKALKRFAEKMITKAKKGDLASRRLLLKKFNERVVKKLVENIGSRFKDRKGGYTRIVKLGEREGDAARMAIIELLSEEK